MALDEEERMQMSEVWEGGQQEEFGGE